MFGMQPLLHFDRTHTKCETRGLVEEGRWFFLWDGQREDAGGLLELAFGS